MGGACPPLFPRCVIVRGGRERWRASLSAASVAWGRVTESRADDRLRRVQARRLRHRRRPIAVRALTVAAGGLLVVLAALLLPPLPEVAFVFGAGGLGLLALEFDWAAHTLACVIEAAGRVRRRLRQLRG